MGLCMAITCWRLWENQEKRNYIHRPCRRIYDQEKLYKNFFGIFPHFSVFQDVLNACTEGYDCLVLDNTSKSNNIQDCVYWYRAKPDRKFKIGSKEILNFLGTGEFVLIAFVFLLLFGPDKIPGFARSAGRAIRKIKDASNDVKKEIHASSKSVDSISSDVQSDLKEIESLAQSVKRGVKKSIDN